jgi:NAD(P)H-nitrite reductase large subunit
MNVRGIKKKAIVAGAGALALIMTGGIARMGMPVEMLSLFHFCHT